MIETQRLYLRKAQLSDALALFEIRNSEFVLKYNAMDVVSFAQMEANVLKDSQNENIYYMEIKDTHQVIGVIYVHDDSLRYQTNTKELSYWLGKEYAHCGYMSEAMNELIRFYFTEKNIAGFTARCFSANVASLRLLEKLGFQREGTLKHAVKGYLDIIYDDVLHYLENK